MAKKQVATEQRPTIKVGAATGMVFCDKCGVIRKDDGTLYDICHVCEEGKWKTTDDIDVSAYAGDVAAHRKQIMDKLSPWELPMPDNVEITLLKANQSTGIDRMNLIMQAHVKAESFYYSAWAQGDIAAKRKKGPPMPEDVKEMLRRRNKGILPIKEDELAKITKKQIMEASKTQLRNMYWVLYSADAGPNLTTDGMRASLLQEIQTREEAKKRPVEVVEAPVASKPKEKAEKAPKATPKAKMPMYEDKNAQVEREKKWTWIIAGSWREDPGHPGGTLVSIKCQKCGGSREIHAADAFQVKLCRTCKPSKGSK
jgi:hypothetical protein